MYQYNYAVGSEEDHLSMDNMQPPITPQFIAQPPQAPPEYVPVQQYIYIARIQRYPMSQQDRSTPLPQPPSMAPRWPPHTPPSAGQHRASVRSFYILPPNMLRYATWQRRPHKARSEGPGAGETLLGCGILLVVGILMLMLLYYLSAAR
jgi:hypothetical protein